MDLVLDTSALLSVLLNEENKADILDKTIGCTLLAPESLDAEIGNALSAMFKRDRITLKNALSVIDQFRLVPIRRIKLDLSEALTICNDHNIYAYDAYMINCALTYSAPLLSLDQRLLQEAQKLGIQTLVI